GRSTATFVPQGLASTMRHFFGGEAAARVAGDPSAGPSPAFRPGIGLAAGFAASMSDETPMPADSALRALYQAARQALCLQSTRIASWLGITTVGAFGVLDPFVFPDRIALLFRVRLAWIAVLLGFLALLRTLPAGRHAVGLSAVVAMFLGVMVNVI